METEEALYTLATDSSNGSSVLDYIPEAVAGIAGAGGGYMLTKKPVFGVVGAIAGVLTVSAVKALFVKHLPPESWKYVSEPYQWKTWWGLDYEMHESDLTECPVCPGGYQYFYVGYPYINGELKSTGGRQMNPPDSLTGVVYFAASSGDVVTLKLAKIDRLGDVTVPIEFTDEVERTIP